MRTGENPSSTCYWTYPAVYDERVCGDLCIAAGLG